MFNLLKLNTTQPLYNTIVRVKGDLCASHPNRAISRAKCIRHTEIATRGTTLISVISKACDNEPCYKEVQVYITKGVQNTLVLKHTSEKLHDTHYH